MQDLRITESSTGKEKSLEDLEYKESNVAFGPLNGKGYWGITMGQKLTTDLHLESRLMWGAIFPLPPDFIIMS
jgi:hypothetical protein